MQQPSPPPNTSAELQELQLQVERGSLFTHTALSSSFARLGQTQVIVHMLLTVMLEKGLIAADEVDAALTRSQQQLAAQGLLPGPGVAMRVDAQSVAPSVPVDCASRIHLCHAACCKLNFALSVAEIEGGHVKWDLGRPYRIRQREDHYCTHIDRTTHQCGIYDHRPGVCHQYSCANDERIWKDFDGMVVNEEWIAEHLSETAVPGLEGVFMIDPA